MQISLAVGRMFAIAAQWHEGTQRLWWDFTVTYLTWYGATAGTNIGRIIKANCSQSHLYREHFFLKTHCNVILLKPCFKKVCLIFRLSNYRWCQFMCSCNRYFSSPYHLQQLISSFGLFILGKFHPFPGQGWLIKNWKLLVCWSTLGKTRSSTTTLFLDQNVDQNDW